MVPRDASIGKEMEVAPGPGSMVLLTRLSRVVYQRATEKVLGMRLKMYSSLNYLREHEGLSQQAMAEALHMDANSCVLLLNDLEAAGLAERRRDPHDRRRHTVALNPAGRRALERAERALESVEDDVLGALDAEERAMLRRLLARALEGTPRPAAAGRHDPPATAGVPTGS
jgi:DNA-binding MarR family transcriptional regulator